MKVLYIATSFPKESHGATIYTDLAEALCDAGHDVTVVVSEQSRNQDVTILMRERGIRVLRVVTGDYYDVSLITKGITMMRMPSLMKKDIKKYLDHSVFDFVLFESPPITNVSLIKWLMKHFQCPSYLMLKDIFPQNAVDIGILHAKGLLHFYFRKMETKMYRVASHVGCMSPANQEYIIEHNPDISKDKIELFPNTKKIKPLPDTNLKLIIRAKYSLPENACIFLFGGNMGKPQYVDLLADACVSCKDDPNIFFLFVGRGTERYKLEKTISENNLSNALLIDNLARDEYEELQSACDVGLIILDPRFTIPNYPSRILSYMESAMPVIAATDKNSDIGELIQSVGFGDWVWSGNIQSFVNTVKQYAANRNKSQNVGMRGRRYLEKYFDVRNSVRILEKHFGQ